MLSNAYFLAKFRFDTAENEPAKNLQNFEKCIFEKCIYERLSTWRNRRAIRPRARVVAGPLRTSTDNPKKGRQCGSSPSLACFWRGGVTRRNVAGGSIRRKDVVQFIRRALGELCLRFSSPSLQRRSPEVFAPPRRDPAERPPEVALHLWISKKIDN